MIAPCMGYSLLYTCRFVPSASQLAFDETRAFCVQAFEAIELFLYCGCNFDG
jgi:hypothetical protein